MPLMFQIASPINKTLTIKSDVQIRMKGNEGMHMTSLEFVLSTDKDVYLRSRVRNSL